MTIIILTIEIKIIIIIKKSYFRVKI